MENPRLDQIRKMLALEPDDEFLNYALAVELEKEGNPSEAIAILRQLLSAHKTYLGAYYKLGQLFEQAGERAEALHVYQQGIELAAKQNNRKTLLELREALQNLDEE
jgi:predicted Zn-dependent protease